MSELNDMPIDSLPEGTEVGGRYVVESILGRGGFAVVYRARDAQLGREVALKVLTANAGQSRSKHKKAVERFEREARVAARFKHPNLVTIFDFGVLDNGQPYYVMELLDGSPLDVLLRKKGGLSPGRWVTMVADALDGLEEAHRLGIVHKDLKPANLFVCRQGDSARLRIVDFGVARSLDEGDAKLSATGEVFGTPQYLAPEYIESQEVSPALDVYQFGLIFVEGLTGEVVVQQANPLHCIMVHGTGALEIHRGLLEGPLGPVIDRALRKDPADRFVSASAFASALRSVDVSELTRPSPDTERLFLADVSGKLEGVVPVTGPVRERSTLDDLWLESQESRSPLADDVEDTRREVVPELASESSSQSGTQVSPGGDTGELPSRPPADPAEEFLTNERPKVKRTRRASVDFRPPSGDVEYAEPPSTRELSLAERDELEELRAAKRAEEAESTSVPSPDASPAVEEPTPVRVEQGGKNMQAVGWVVGIVGALGACVALLLAGSHSDTINQNVSANVSPSAPRTETSAPLESEDSAKAKVEPQEPEAETPTTDEKPPAKAPHFTIKPNIEKASLSVDGVQHPGLEVSVEPGATKSVTVSAPGYVSQVIVLRGDDAGGERSVTLVRKPRAKARPTIID